MISGGFLYFTLNLMAGHCNNALNVIIYNDVAAGGCLRNSGF